MPYCFGSVCQNTDEDDLTHCHCDPCDPIVAQLDLAARTFSLISLLREKRRQRRIDRQAVQRLVTLARVMRGSTNQYGLLAAWDEVAGIARRLEGALNPARTDDAVARVGGVGTKRPRASEDSVLSDATAAPDGQEP